MIVQENKTIYWEFIYKMSKMKKIKKIFFKKLKCKNDWLIKLNQEKNLLKLVADRKIQGLLVKFLKIIKIKSRIEAKKKKSKREK